MGGVLVEARGMSNRKPIALAVALITIGSAAFFAYRTASQAEPSTDDASIDADFVHIASLVGGRITELPVHENGFVHRGDLLFRIDPAFYETNLAAAEAQLDISRAAVGSKSRLIKTQDTNTLVAAEQIRRAEQNLDLSIRTEERLQPLAESGYVPRQQLDNAVLAHQDAETSLREARDQELAAHESIEDTDAATASVRAARAVVRNARKALTDTEVRAPHNGRIVGLTISSGEVVAPSQSLFTLINTEEWFASANVREFELRRVKVGACATVYSMLDRDAPIKGVVESIGYGVLADDRINVPRNAPYVQPSLNWVRVAQRFPVRIRLEDPPDALVRLGASASVEIDHGRSCR